jgi:hypothetical protein
LNRWWTKNEEEENKKAAAAFEKARKKGKERKARTRTRRSIAQVVRRETAFAFLSK